MNEHNLLDFWVIFDTCTFKKYYLDVHNLLALPNGSIIRYSYQEKWLTPRAVRTAETFPDCTKEVLLLYGQYEGYNRGEDHEDYEGEAERVWVPTRLARLVDCEISKSRDKTEYYFDLEVGDYPGLDSGGLKTLMNDLEEKQEAPFNKWVAISGKNDSLRALKEESGGTESWKQVVDRFGRIEAQFSGDVFWRLKAVRSRDRNKVISCSYSAALDRNIGRRPYSYYKVTEGEKLSFDLEYRFGYSNVSGSLYEEGRSIEIDEKTAPLKMISPKRIELRSYYAESLDANVDSKIGTEGILRFMTSPRRDDWPTGAELSLRFEVGDVASTEKVQKLALILKGGGVKGVALAGAVQELEMHHKFTTYVGTSAGAIVGALLASGFKASEIVGILFKLDFGSLLLEGGLKRKYNLLMKKGMHSGEPLTQWLSDQIHKKNSTMTGVRMKDLKKRLIVYAMGTRSGTVVFDSKGSNRDVSVPFAARCSASLPPVFIPAQHDGEDIYDGGMLHNFPVEEFKKLVSNERFIAIYLGRDTAPSFKRPSLIKGIWGIYTNRDEKVDVKENIESTVIIDTGPIETTKFDLSKDEKEFLVLQGRVAALRFLSKGQFEAPIDKKYLLEVEERAKLAREKLEKS